MHGSERCLGGRSELLLLTGEGSRLARIGLRRPERRKRVREPFDDELRDRLRAFEILQLVLAEVDQADVGRQRVLDEPARGPRQENLTTVSGRADSSRPVHGEPDEARPQA